MVKLHAAWADLTDVERKQWNQFISYSSSTIRRDHAVLQSGHSLFLQYNMLRLLTDLAIMELPLYQPLTGIFDSIQLGFDDLGALELTLEDEYPGTKTFSVVQLSPPRRPSLSFTRSGLRGIHIASDDELDFDITSQYVSIFGSIPIVGDTIHYSLRRFSTISPLIQNPIYGKLIVHAYEP